MNGLETEGCCGLGESSVNGLETGESAGKGVVPV